jgi:membrane protein implicated in regulation of membrane protease activity
MLTIREQQIGLLTAIECLAASVFVAGALAWGWYLTLVLWLILVALPYIVLWVIRNFEQDNDLFCRPRQPLAKEKSGSQEQILGR